MNYMQCNNNKFQNNSYSQQRFYGQQSNAAVRASQRSGCCEKPSNNSCGCAPVNDCTCRPAPTPVAPCPRPTDCMEQLIKSDPLCSLPLAMAYVPWQNYQDLFDCGEALCQGTMFKQLVYEFMGRRCN